MLRTTWFSLYRTPVEPEIPGGEMATIAQKRDTKLYLRAVVRLIRMGARENLRKVVSKAHPSDLATILEEIGINERREFLPLIYEGCKLGETLIEMIEGLRDEIIAELEDQMMAQLVIELSSDDAVDLLESLDEDP
jgi:magnesium transporter